jgi:TolB-like protein/cytochrome c-type biogenesis protein CcmH/NrfG
MSDAGKAVFLSYASQDADAARRIADALRAAGAEVWFDQSELRGGDSWDAAIRKQIKECALFVPIISANTQTRAEGYFRLEWRLADHRTHLMGRAKAFLLPVCVDDTKDSDADVPDSFLAVQWMRLRGGEADAAFGQRVKRLLNGGNVAAPAPGSQPHHETPVATAVVAVPRSSRRWWPASLAAVLAIGAGLWWWRAPADGPVSSPLVAQVWEQLNKAELARAELDLADGLARQATEAEPRNADAWAAWSQVDSWFSYSNLDPSAARREGARAKATRAIQLAPTSYEARLARACQLVRGQGDRAQSLYASEAGELLRALLQERTDEPRALLALGILQRNTGDTAGACATFDRLADNPAFAALAWNETGWARFFALEIDAAEMAIDRSIALQPYWGNLFLKTLILQYWRGNLDRALDALERIPVSVRQEDLCSSFAAELFYWRREPEAMLRVLDEVPRDWLQSGGYNGPKAHYIALAHELAGRREAARLHWQRALDLVQLRLADEPDSNLLHHWKGHLLAYLGQRPEAEYTLRLAREMGPAPERVFAVGVDWILVGQLDDALAALERIDGPSAVVATAAALRLNPRYDPIHEQPRFQALLKRMEADPRFSPKATQGTEDGRQRTEDVDQAKELSASQLVPSSDKSVAVLAFANLSDDKGNEYFSDGISEELLNVLAKIPKLKVSARTSSFHFKGKDTPIPEIARQLGVDYVVEGSVRRAGDRVRITAQLIQASDGFHVWSDTFTRELKDIFAVQDEIAGLIAGQLQLKLGSSAETRKIVNPEAYRLVLEGHHFWLQRTDADLVRAETLFQQASAIAPDFARAHAGLAGVWMIRDWYRIVSGLASDPDEHARSKAAAERAISLDPTLAEPYAILGVLLFNEKKETEAAQAFQTALRLNPNYSFGHHWYSHMLMASGQLDAALAEMNRAVQLDPLSFVTLLISSMWHGFAGRYDEAVALSDRAVQFGPEFFVPLLAERSHVLQAVGRTGEAVALARRVAANWDPQTRWWADPTAIHLLRQAGLTREARDYADRLLSAVPADYKLRSFVSVALGQNEEALDQLSRLGPPSSTLGALFYSSLWDEVRDDPRFMQVITGLGMREAYERARAERARLSAERELKK